jgi:hypothetical protein
MAPVWVLTSYIAQKNSYTLYSMYYRCMKKFGMIGATVESQRAIWLNRSLIHGHGGCYHKWTKLINDSNFTVSPPPWHYIALHDDFFNANMQKYLLPKPFFSDNLLKYFLFQNSRTCLYTLPHLRKSYSIPVPVYCEFGLLILNFNLICLFVSRCRCELTLAIFLSTLRISWSFSCLTVCRMHLCLLRSWLSSIPSCLRSGSWC